MKVAKPTFVVAAIVSITISQLPINAANVGRSPYRRRTTPITANTSISPSALLKSPSAAQAKSVGMKLPGMLLKNYLVIDDTTCCVL